MREIKFRAFYKGERYPIFEGGLEEYEKPRMIYNIQDIYDGSGADDSGNGVGHVSCFGSFLDDEDYIVGQYTGLKDNNGTEIYEGDIIWDAHNEEHGKVTFDEGAFCVEWETHIEHLNEVVSDYYAEVIGNIYENPELLGDSQ